MQFLTTANGNRKLDTRFGYMDRNMWIHKHRFRMTYYPGFFYVAFICKQCDEVVIVERDVWNSMIRLGQDWRALWRR